MDNFHIGAILISYVKGNLGRYSQMTTNSRKVSSGTCIYFVKMHMAMRICLHVYVLLVALNYFTTNIYSDTMANTEHILSTISLAIVLYG